MRRHLAKLANILLVFAVAGPLFGLILFATTIGLIGFFFGPKDAHYMGPFLLIYGLFFAHYIGVPWALLAGAAATVLSHWWGLARWIGPLSGAISYAVSAMTAMVYLPPGSNPPAESAIDAFGTAFIVAAAVTHIGAATLCWMIVRTMLERRVSA